MLLRCPDCLHFGDSDVKQEEEMSCSVTLVNLGFILTGVKYIIP